jgi:hypothetical protein
MRSWKVRYNKVQTPLRTAPHNGDEHNGYNLKKPCEKTFFENTFKKILNLKRYLFVQ